MHQHIIAAAHVAATTQASGGDRNALAIGVAALVFVCGVAFSRKKRPSTS
jgi:hypothetical protein